MISNFELIQNASVTRTLSAPRIETYATAVGFSPAAGLLEKYTWNALISAAFFSSLHICEVAVRNAVADALAKNYGAEWPWNFTFEKSLPAGFRYDFVAVRDKITRDGASAKTSASGKKYADPKFAFWTGKVIADLRFAFWCDMFTKRHQERLWVPHLNNEFPNMPVSLTTSQGRECIRSHLDVLRKFRNRIAHHEPIFAEPLEAHHEKIKSLIDWRCTESGIWLSQWETVTATLAKKP
jgi:hypothetical protein